MFASKASASPRGEGTGGERLLRWGEYQAAGGGGGVGGASGGRKGPVAWSGVSGACGAAVRLGVNCDGAASLAVV